MYRLESYIYIAKVAGYKSIYKIGCSRNPESRVRALSVKYNRQMRIVRTFRSLDSSFRLEGEIHFLLRHYLFSDKRTPLSGKEFFNVDAKEAVKVIEMCVDYFNKRDTYNRKFFPA